MRTRLVRLAVAAASAVTVDSFTKYQAGRDAVGGASRRPARRRRPPRVSTMSRAITPVEGPHSMPELILFGRHSNARKRRAPTAKPGRGAAPPVGGDVGGCDNFCSIIGAPRSRHRRRAEESWLIVDPADGKIPPTLPEDTPAQCRARRTGQPGRIRNDIRRRRYDNPEERPLGERCLLSFGLPLGLHDAPQLLLQQPETNRADAGYDDDSQ